MFQHARWAAEETITIVTLYWWVRALEVGVYLSLAVKALVIFYTSKFAGASSLAF